MKRKELLKALASAGVLTALGCLDRVESAPPVPSLTITESSLQRSYNILVYKEGDAAVAVSRKGEKIIESSDHVSVIQGALDYVSGGRVFIKKSDTEYLIESNISLKSNVELVSDGAVLKAATTLPDTVNGIISDKGGAVENVLVFGLVLDANNTSINISRFAQGSKKIVFLNCTFKNGPYAGIELAGASSVEVRGCYFENVRSNIIAKNTTTHGIRVVDNEFTGEPFAYALSVQNGAHDVVFANNYVHDFNRAGNTVTAVLLEDNYPTYERAYNVVICGNVFTNMGYDFASKPSDGSCIMLGDSYRAVVIGNVLWKMYKSGIDVANSLESIVKGNVIVDVYGDGITSASSLSKTIIEGNLIVNAGRAQSPTIATRGINLYGTYNIVRNNLIIGDGSYPQTGIEERTGADYNTIEGNQIIGVPTKVVKAGAHSYVQGLTYTSLPTDGFATDKPIIYYDGTSYYLAVWDENAGVWRKVALA